MPVGRRILLDAQKIQALAASDWTLREIAHEMGVSHDTLERHYRDDINKGRAKGTGQLKLKAHQEALAGNDKMLALLLKQRCGYSEKQEIELSGNKDKPIVVSSSTLTEEEIDQRIKVLLEELKQEELEQNQNDS